MAIAAHGTMPPRAPGACSAWVPWSLAILWCVAFVALGWTPHDRDAWILENLIAVPTVLLLIGVRPRVPWSASCWCLVFAFLGLHEIGSHYTYSLVPWAEWVEAATGVPVRPERNHYDRVLHFAFGLLCTVPIRELLRSPIRARNEWLGAVAIATVATASGLYEIAEWLAAELVDPALGMGFVGAQGDIWDAQKDMALALLGSALALAIDWRSGLGGRRQRAA